MRGPLGGWRALLRLAWRDVLRNKGRSALILAMIALPVLGVTAAHVVISTADVSVAEGLDRHLGTADALLEVNEGGGVVYQGADPHDNAGWAGPEDGGTDRTATQADIAKVLGEGTKLHAQRLDWFNTRIGQHNVNVTVHSADFRDPVFDGTWDLTAGRAPARVGEIAVNAQLVKRGVRMGDTVELVTGRPLEVVGEAEDASYRGEPSAWAYPGSVDDTRQGPMYSTNTTYLATVPGGVDWDAVRALNKLGVSVLSREVIAHPPSEDQLPPEMSDFGDDRADVILATAILVSTMALLEVVLLAGPAFAVGARRMQRNLAQVAATGGTPGQVRRAVLATAVVLGGIAAGVGLVVGVVLGRVGVPIAQHYDQSVFGPFDVVWSQVLLIALLGWLSAVIAALVPAWIASRQDIVKVLGGRRGDRAPGKASPVLGALLAAAGIAAAVVGARHGGDWGTIAIAAAAVLAVVGGVLLLSPVLALVGRLAGRAPLPLRYAVRDAARHRARTVPAIGAVLATVTGVVALCIANASDAEESRETYRPSAGLHAGFVSFDDATLAPDERAVAWHAIEKAVHEEDPESEVMYQLGHMGGMPGDQEVQAVEGRDGGSLLSGWGGYMGSWIVDDHVPAADLGLDASGKAKAAAALAAGKVVLFTDGGSPGVTRDGKVVPPDLHRDSVDLQVTTYGEDGAGHSGRTTSAPAEVIRVSFVTTQGIVPHAVAKRTGAQVMPSTISLPGPVSKAEKDTIEKALAGIGYPDARVYVERGWNGRDNVLLLWVLAALGGVLMLGGTLTATFLALSDAAPDLATLSAVGASPRERRLVAACYALVVGGIGAVGGAVIGLVPGIAATWPLTSNTWDGAGPSHYLDIPWLVILVVVVGLPLLTALVVGLCARSRLPLVARID
ncbi:FtsX-like permease family protein [Nocardioides jiangxiensis]|uniref:ABC3 transporter permease C-terminal domain-containing protein n=1 Tax=Nocardioides jiangxiensis TaxID=3064524 RepID=A0ABT9B018_9ACTN|nr:FtsX-like permease family protein [Nocardioides sp. WY-20]MDO7868057.1 hypothetical protein [Nocardioides sp. WY-20]